MNIERLDSFDLRPIGRVVSPLTDASTAPRQPDEGAPSAWLHFDPSVLDALSSLTPGDEVILLTWLDRADRSVLRVHPRGDRSRPQEGVFSTRSPHRPNRWKASLFRVIDVRKGLPERGTTSLCSAV